MNEQDRDQIDSVLQSAYDALRDEPIPEPDWNNLHAAIMAEARPMVRRNTTLLGRMPRGFVSLAAAAGIAVVLWGLPQMTSPPPGNQVAADGGELVDEDTFVATLADDISETEFRLLVTGRSNPEAMLSVAVSSR